MTFPEDAARLDLQAGETLNLHNGKNANIHVQSGELWVTQEGDLRDILLRSGSRFQIERDGLTLIRAFRKSRVDVQPEAQSAPAKGLKALGQELIRRFAPKALFITKPPMVSAQCSPGRP